MFSLRQAVLRQYRHSFRKAILNPNSIVLVVEDNLDRSETHHVYEALEGVYPPFEEQILRDSLDKGKAVVSVASLSLLPGAGQHGQFQPNGMLSTVGFCSLPARDITGRAIFWLSIGGGSASTDDDSLRDLRIGFGKDENIMCENLVGRYLRKFGRNLTLRAINQAINHTAWLTDFLTS
ncbi:hypothetical protein QBC41DRAFT_141000 [Cercophora samala]|uniref:Uncharacterized protein n=1 Tax=Cercophora samala TaxID=330535 RepID=A0AA40DBB0_9PEZI|nr:hypothetical protein QBC41DRAFT_141000 [Cercophora samala]